MENLSVTEIMAIRSSCNRGYSKEDAFKLLTESESKLEKFKEDNKDILSRLNELESERCKWKIYIKEFQYMVGKCYEYENRGCLKSYIRVSACGSGGFFTGQVVVVEEDGSYRRGRGIRVYDFNNLKEISQETFDELWNKAEE